MHETGKTALHAQTSTAANTAPLRITPLGHVDHSDYGEKGVKLVYAERPDRSLVRVDQLEEPRPPLICPLCRTPVHGCKSKTGLRFFRHNAGGEGCGGPETNAHLWAKAELLKARKVFLPAATSAYPGVELELQAARWFEFVDIEVEVRRGDLIPDLVAKTIGADGELFEFWIEVYVTHKCGAPKIAKIKAAGPEAIEIDLSRFRTSYDAAAIREALLEGPRRHWLHNRAIEADFEERTKRAEADRARKEAEARRKTEALIQAFRDARAIAPSAADKATVARIEALGLSDVIGLTAPRPFAVPEKVWQAIVWDKLVVPPLAAGKSPPPLKPSEALSILRRYVPPGLSGIIDRDQINAVKAIEPGFVAPLDALTTYFRALERKGDFWCLDFPKWHVSGPRQAAIRAHFEAKREAIKQTKALRRRIENLLNQSPEKVRIDLDIWFEQPCLKGVSPSGLIGMGDTGWRRLDEAVRDLERMVTGAPVDDLLGLPLAPIRAEAVLRKAQADAEEARRQAERAAKEADDRVAALVVLAEHRLGAVAQTWLSSGPEGGPSFRELAAQSPAGLTKAQNALWVKVAHLADEAEKARRFSLNLAEISRRAGLFYDDVKKALFLNTTRRELGGKAPKDAVADDEGLRASLALLPRKPERRGH